MNPAVALDRLVVANLNDCCADCLYLASEGVWPENSTTQAVIREAVDMYESLNYGTAMSLVQARVAHFAMRRVVDLNAV